MIYALVRLCVASAQNFAQRHLRHYLPIRIKRNDDTVQFPEQARSGAITSLNFTAFSPSGLGTSPKQTNPKTTAQSSRL